MWQKISDMMKLLQLKEEKVDLNYSIHQRGNPP